jgi:Asp-tRNA(Asn)/Glu-tRNA(Gln) amidotransferase C subunit
MDKEEIKRQAKEIMDNFARALAKVKVVEGKVERKEDRREEKEGEEADSDFRKIMFENAPKTKDGCIEAEKGEWLE